MKFIVANWKMNPQNLAEAKSILSSIKKGLNKIKKIEIVICPPFLFVSSPIFKNSSFKLGAQDVFFEEKGAFTGEISPKMLKSLGCEYVIIGHSERRKLGETDEVINKKIKSALTSGLKVILCIGETEKEKKAGKTKIILERQLKADLDRIENCPPAASSAQPMRAGKLKIDNLILAYEPVWAIGTGNACDADYAKEVVLFLKKSLKNLPILYGGSVNSNNALSYIKDAGFDGLLIGGASLNPEEFKKIVKEIDLFLKSGKISH
ncbi:MAG: triose-phosphate isomerase [Candidatus Pacebacteria bacterium]|nr:triose-phosphate isomerase [Candidatus Paceibacterota bacterium]